MSTYSTDEELAVYVADLSVLPEILMPLHEEAYRQIRRDLRAQGRTLREIDALTDETKAALKVPACYYVLYLHWQGQTHDNGGVLLDRAKHYLSEYRKAMASTPILSSYLGEVDGVNEASADAGRVWLG